jgi:peptidyl-prolyl cis-trans isomerase SurA
MRRAIYLLRNLRKTERGAKQFLTCTTVRTAPFALLILSYALPGAVVLDRIAVIVGKHVIKESDIERDLRLTEFLNGQPLDLSPAAKRQAAERLIDQEIIRQELATGSYQRPSESEASELLDRLRRDRFGGSDSRLREALARYRLTEDDLRQQLLWQLTVLRFIDQRFRVGVLVTDEEVRAYCGQHLTELRRQYPTASNCEALAPKIKSLLEGERINQNFNEWLAQARKSDRIEYRQEAFQ